MIKTVKTINLKIANFPIKLVFHPTDWPANRDHLIQEVLFMLSGFMVKTSPKKTGIKIHFIDRLNLNILSNKAGNKNFINFYEYRRKKSYTSFYHIGIIQLNIIIRTILQNFLADSNGLIIHGSAVLNGRQAYIFLGRSGAGKSTIMNLLADKYKPLADDTIIIKKENKRYYLYQTPMMDKQAWVKKTSRKYAVGKLFFLRQKDSYTCKKIKNKNSITKKMIKVFFTNKNHSKEQMKFLLEFISCSDLFYDLYSGLDKKKVFDLFS